MISNTIKTFLRPVLKTVCEMLSLKDSNGNFLTTSPVIEYSAYMAMGQIESYIRRPLYKAARVEIYRDVWDELLIKNSPIDSVTEVKVGDDILTVDEQYTVYPSRILIPRPDQSDSFAIGDDLYLSKRIDVVVSYTGGYTNSDDNLSIYSSLISQTIVNNSRRLLPDGKNISSHIGSGGHSVRDFSGSSSSGGGGQGSDLVGAAASTLDMLVYRGNAEVL